MSRDCETRAGSPSLSCPSCFGTCWQHRGMLSPRQLLLLLVRLVFSQALVLRLCASFVTKKMLVGRDERGRGRGQGRPANRAPALPCSARGERGAVHPGPGEVRRQLRVQRRPGLRERVPEVLGVHKGVDGAFQKPGECPTAFTRSPGPHGKGQQLFSLERQLRGG